MGDMFLSAGTAFESECGNLREINKVLLQALELATALVKENKHLMTVGALPIEEKITTLESAIAKAKGME